MNFANPVSIEFGRGVLERLPDVLGPRGCVVVTTPGAVAREVLARVEQTCGSRIEAVLDDIAPNPTPKAATEAARGLSRVSADVIVALGGGSSLDTAKAIAAQRHPDLDDEWLASHLAEGAAFPEGFSPARVIAIPTTAGTGSEVTCWATLWDPKVRRKHSLAHPRLFPETALVDPELTLSLPRELTVSCALDALSHAMEAVWNKSSNPVSDALALRAIATLPRALRDVLGDPGDVVARASLQEASVLAGLASSGTRTALAHSMSYALTLSLGLPHGLACGLTLPAVLDLNGSAYPDRARLIGEALCATSLDSAVKDLYAFFAEIGVPEMLARYLPSLDPLDPLDDLDDLEGDLVVPSRAGNNLVAVGEGEGRSLLEGAVRELLAHRDGA
ncbi:MAG: phosphonoacetaldehyde reductase [Myxococcales bacterium]|nr:phosphonoacetaldehyde reductase [Myxococcales bacterium]